MQQGQYSTIAELQTCAGTVSNALNNRPGVAKKPNKILKLAGNSYEKNLIPKVPLKESVIMYKRTGHILSDTPFFANLIEGMQKQCRAANYEMVVTHISKGEDSEQQIKDLKYDKLLAI